MDPKRMKNPNAGEGRTIDREVVSGRAPSRRDVLKAGTTVAVGAGAMPLLAGDAGAQGRDQGRDRDAATLERLIRAARDPRRRILLKGATIITMDSAVGDFARADLLIEGKKISAVGADLGAAALDGKAIVVDADDTILIPGMIDCHRHAWEGQIRGVIPNSATIGDYMAATHRGFAPHYRPEDMYVGNFLTALGCIDAGITCFIDNSHNSRSSAHSDAAVQALFDSGVRAVHASGAPTFAEWDRQWPQDVSRLARRYFASDDQLVTLRLFSRGLVKDDWETARRLGLWLSIDGAGAPNSAQTLQEFQTAGLMDERHTVNHGYGLPDASWELIRGAGMSVNACPRSDSQWALGSASMGLQEALNHGIRPGLSVDNESAFSTDLFTEMRVAFHLQRWMAHGAASRQEPNPPMPLTVRDMLEFATVRGAQNAALQGKIGTLTPGKEADIVVTRADDINTMPLTNAVSTVVSHAHAGNVDAVFIAGEVRKWGGGLVGHDLAKVRERVRQSRDHLFAQRGYKLDILA
jgi:5-methylthioadenosine/S-adenosylhomocysteine deaminase